MKDIKLKKRLGTWIVVNFGVLGLFLYGNMTEVSNVQVGLLNIAVFMYWVMSILGIFGFSDRMAKEIVQKKEPYDTLFTLPKTLDIAFDTFVLLTLVYFGYFFLGAFYFVHILAMNVLRTKMEVYMKIKNEEYSSKTNKS